MQNSKYPNGYKFKVNYYLAHLQNANNTNDPVELQYALKKLTYFTDKHIAYLDAQAMEVLKVTQETNADNIPY